MNNQLPNLPEDCITELKIWLKNVFPELNHPLELMLLANVCDDVHTVLFQNSMLRLDKFTITEICDDNSDTIKKYVYNRYEDIEHDIAEH